jgi:hypothetical protein
MKKHTKKKAEKTTSQSTDSTFKEVVCSRCERYYQVNTRLVVIDPVMICSFCKDEALAQFLGQFNQHIEDAYIEAQDELDCAKLERAHMIQDVLEAAKGWQAPAPMPEILADFVITSLSIAKAEDTISHWRGLYWRNRGKRHAFDLSDELMRGEYAARLCEWLAFNREADREWAKSRLTFENVVAFVETYSDSALWSTLALEAE